MKTLMKVHIKHKIIKTLYSSTCLGSKQANQSLITSPKLKSQNLHKTPKIAYISSPKNGKARNRKRKFPIMKMELLYSYKNTHLRDGKESLHGRSSNGKSFLKVGLGVENFF